MVKAKYGKPKPYMSIGTIDHVDHDKTTLAAATTKVLADEYPKLNESTPFDEVDNAPGGRQRDITINIFYVEYQADKRHYAHVDVPEHTDYIKSMITGTAQVDDTILVVIATDGPMAQTCEHVLLARQVGAPNPIVALNKADMVDDEGILEPVGTEVHELLSSQEHDSDNIPVIRVSALRILDGDAEQVSFIEEFMGEVGSYLPDSIRDLDKPFLMPIEDVFMITGRRTVVTGRVERGLFNVNEEVGILGIRPTQKTAVTGIEMFHKQVNHAGAGENYGLFLRGTKREEIGRDQAVAKPGMITPHTNFEVQIYILKKEEDGRHNPFFPNYRPQFYFHTTDVTGVTTLPEGTEIVIPGGNTEMMVELIQPIAVEKGFGSAIREGDRTAGSERITKTIR